MAINTRNNSEGVNVIVDGTFGPWETVTATNIQAEYGKAYILDGSSPQTITLPPATPGSEGKGFAIKGQSTQLFTIAQNLSQSIDGIGWSTISGPSGGLQSLDRNCTIILLSLFDSGLIFSSYGIGGYFDVIGENITIYNDGIINFEDGELLIGSAADKYPVRGNIISSDGSVVITNQRGQIDITGAGGGGSPIAATLCDGGFYQDLGTLASQTLSAVDTWEIVSQGIYTDSSLNNFDLNGVRLTYTGTETTDLDVSFTLTTDNLAANNNEYLIGIFKNGSANPEQDATNTYENGTDADNAVMTVSRNITFSTGDYVEPFLRASNNLDFNFRELSFKVYGFAAESATPSDGFDSVATTNYVVESQDTSYSITGTPYLTGMCYSSSGELFLSRDVANGISTYNIFTNEISLNVIPLTAVGNFLPYYNDIVFMSGTSRTDVFDMKTKTVTENIAVARPGGYFGRGVFDPITNKFYFAPLGATDILSFDPIALTYTPVALGSLPVGENDYVNIIRSSKTGKFYLIPRNSTTGAIAIFDPVAETVDLTTLNIGAGSNLFSSPGCEGYDEKIYSFGRTAAYIAVIDPVAESIDTTTYPLTNFFGNATLFPDNTIRSHSQLNPGQFAIVDLDNGGAFSTISGNNQFPSAMIVTYTGKVFGVSGTNNGRFMYTYSRKRAIPIERCISFMVNYN